MNGGQTLFILLLIGLGAAVIHLVLQTTKQKEQFSRQLEEKYQEGKEAGQDEAGEIFRRTMDLIQDDRDKLNAMSEKKLLVEIMVSLSSYGRRLDRIDKQLKRLENNKKLIDDLNGLVKDASKKTEALNKSIVEMNDSARGFKETIAKTNAYVETVNENLASIEKVEDSIDTTISYLEGVDKVLKETNTNISSIIQETTLLCRDIGNGPISTLNELDQKVNQIITLSHEIEAKTTEIYRETERSLREAEEKEAEVLEEPSEDVKEETLEEVKEETDAENASEETSESETE